MPDLARVEKNCTASIFELLELRGIGHSGGSLSVLQTLIALYFDIAQVDPKEPKWPDRDRIVLSKAHAVEAMYAVLAERGYFSKERFKEYLQLGSDLQGHTEITTPGVEYSGGSLGQGLGFGCGLAYAARLRNKSYKTFVIMGDGECHEGSVWESAMLAAHFKLDNVYAIVDHNHYADHDNVDVLMNLQPFESKWRSFGWETVVVPNGNDISAVSTALRGFHEAGKPKCLIADTVKNFGVPLWVEKHLHQVHGDLLRKGVEQGRKIHNVG